MDLVIFSLFALFFLHLLWPLTILKKKRLGNQIEAPCVPGYLPILGHLHKLGGTQPLAITLSAMADKIGPIFTLWIGGQRAVVVNSWDLAKECFTTNDKALAGRTESVALKHLTCDYAMFGFASYGDYWREVRKIVNLQLLSSHRLELTKHIRSKEVELCIKDLYRRWESNGGEPVKVEMREWFGNLMLNNILTSVAGKRYFGTHCMEDEEMGKDLRKLTAKFFHFAGKFVVSDAVPWLERADIGGYIKEIRETAAGLYRFVSSWVEEHRLRRRPTDHVDEDFIDVMLSNAEKLPSFHDPDTTVRTTSMSMILGGTDTSSATMTWALSLLMNNRHALERAQQELDEKVGKERNVEESDIESLSYLQAIIKETMRLYPVGPLSAPHKAMEDCQVGGYHVPAGTTVITNIWKIQHDPTIWADPEEFRPERFLTSHADVDVKGQHFALIPFGAGRRVCPGELFSLRIMHLTLARLLHGFKMDIPAGCPVDMSMGSGLSLPKATPLDVVCSPRLSSTLYM